MKLCNNLLNFCTTHVLEKLCKGVNEKELKKSQKARERIKGFVVALLQ